MDFDGFNRGNFHVKMDRSSFVDIAISLLETRAKNWLANDELT
jgi:hypothetical protein